VSPNQVRLKSSTISLIRPRLAFGGGVTYFLKHGDHPDLAFRLTYTEDGHLVSFEVGDPRAVVRPGADLDLLPISDEREPPAKRLSARRLRSLPLGSLDGFVRRHMAATLGKLDPDLLDSFSDAPVRPGRRGHTDHVYVLLAARYVELQGSGREIQDLAAEVRSSPLTVRNKLAEARRRGLLDNPGRGKAGGGLTEKARRLLKEM